MDTVLDMEKVQELIDLVYERYGYYFGKRAVMSRMFKETTTERQKLRELSREKSGLIALYLKTGKDVRKELSGLQNEINRTRGILRKKSAPYWDTIRPLNQALSFMDKQLIPAKLEEVTGRPVEARVQLSAQLAKEVNVSKKGRRRK